MTKLIVDENIPRDAKEWLVKKGFDTINISPNLLKGAKDRVIAEYAAKNKMAIITLDKGFARIYRAFPKDTLTIIIIKANPATPANIIDTLDVAQKKINLKQIQTKLVIVTKKRIRIIT